MSKLIKFIKTPKLFFADSRKRNALRVVSEMGDADLKRFGKITGIGLKTEKSKLSLVPKDTSRNDDLLLSNKLLNFERSFPVNSLKSGNIHGDMLLWPFFRHLLWVRCQATYKGKNAAAVNTSKMYISEDWQQHYKKQLPAKTLDELDVDSLDFLFFTNLRGTEQTMVNNHIYNRITDPIYEVASKLGKAKKVEVIKSIGEVHPKRIHDADLILPPLLRKIGYATLTEAPKDFVTRVNQLLPEAKFTDKNYNDCIEWFFHQRDFYTELLQRYNPKVIFFVGFDYHYALVSAAKALGIHSVDLQHGVQAGWSPVYNHWQVVPREGYEMLPDTFWVWGDYDARKVVDNFDCNSVDAIVGGFPWLDRQSDFLLEKQPESLNKISKDKKIGLLTLQDQTEFPQLFERIIHKTAAQIQWVIKRHPKHKKINLSRIKGKALFGKDYDQVSFLTLIRTANIHLTECSTAVIEADYFGVPSVVTGEQGILNYSDFIDQGTVHHVETADEFVEQLESYLDTVEKSQMSVVDNSATESALKQLLEKNSV